MERQGESFKFKEYSVYEDKKTVEFSYGVTLKDGKKINFTEKIIFPKEIAENDLVLQGLHLILGISYFKLYCPKKISVPYDLNEDQVKFWNTVYTKGLGEFFYRNKIDFRNLIDFAGCRTFRDPDSVQPNQASSKILLGIGGGKDSIVAFELLKKQNKDMTGFIVKNSRVESTIQEEVARVMGIDYLVVIRELDSQLWSLKNAYQGHVPISAIIAFIALLLAVSYGYGEIITANEKSANFGNVEYLSEIVNHQWSKSEEFEHMFQRYVTTYIDPHVRYRSVLRQYSELQITEKFATHEKYFPVFASCNNNFSSIKKNDSRWCGKCAKCAFVFLTLAAYLPKEKLIKIFHKNLFGDKELLSVYRDLLGKGEMKPFDCVGTFEEANEALAKVIKRGEFKEDFIIKNL